MNHHVFIWSVNVLLQVTCVSAFGLALAAFLRRYAVAKYWVLCPTLCVMLLSPLLTAAMLQSGRSLISVTLLPTEVSLPEATVIHKPVISDRSANLRLDVPPFDHDNRVLESQLPPTGSNDAAGPAPIPHSQRDRSDRGITPSAAFHTASIQRGRNAPSKASPTPPRLADQPFTLPVRQTTLATTVRAVLPALVWIWFAGAAMLLARLARSWWRLHQLLRNAEPCRNEVLDDVLARVARDFELQHLPEIVLSDRLSGPISAGLIRPRVVLPLRLIDTVSTVHLRDILVHEVAHIVRRDQLIVLLQNVAGAIYWLHPLARALNRALAQAREEVCDNYVLATTNAPSYSRTLLTLAEFIPSRAAVPGAVNLFTSKWKLENRVAGLLDERRNRMLRLSKRAKLLVIALSLTLAAVAAVLTVTLDDGKQPDKSQTVVAKPDVAKSEKNATTAKHVAQDSNAPVLRGTGKNREMLVKGRVVDVDGTPARDIDLSVNVKRQFGRNPRPTKIQEGQFEFWVPIGSDDWLYLELSAKTKDGKRRATQGISIQALRQAAISGVVLQLANADRLVKVSVNKAKQPIEGAHVTAQTQSSELLHGETDEQGTVTFRLLKDEKLQQLTAWTDDYLIGGYSFSRKPRRDPLGTEHTIELENCRDETIRFLHAEDDSPVPNVAFELTIGTGAPNYNFPAVPGTFPHCNMTTNERGEATFRWFPDWEKHGAYVTIADSRWARALEDVETADDGALVMKLKPRVHRKPLVGKVTSEHFNVSGLMLQIRSFQADEESRSDHLYAFTDADGNFTANCIPGSTYCVCVNDVQLTSNTIDLIPHEPDTGKSNVAELTVSEGETVEIRVTSGPNRVPMRNQRVYIRDIHKYTWFEDGERKKGSGGRMWGVYTDDSGIALIRALAESKLEVSVNAGAWRSDDRRVTVKSDGVTTIEFHRAIDVERAVTGRLIAPRGSGVDLANAEIVYGSIGGETDEEKTITADNQGRFAFDTRAIQLGIFAYTADGKAAGVAKPETLDGPVDIQLKPTANLHGQLRGDNDEPLANHAVRVRPLVKGKRDLTKSFSTSFRTKTFETRTDSEGNYTLKNLPTDLDMRLRADSIDGSDSDAYLDDFFLVAGEERPLMVSRLDRKSRPDNRSLSEKYTSVLRDAKLGHFHLLVIVFDSTANDFVAQHLRDYEKTKEIAQFMNLRIRKDDVEGEDARKFVESKNWPQPERGKVFACALDGTGKELGRIVLDTRSALVQVQAAEFIQKHTPSQVDAKAKWNAAFAEAKRSGRKVWARVSQRYCAPCFRLSRWLDDNRELLERDYVLLKIDNTQDKHGVDIANRIISGRERFGVPFHAIFDANEKLLIDSEGPTGNIGHPSSYDGRRHLTKMLTETKSNLTTAQIEQIVSTLK